MSLPDHISWTIRRAAHASMLRQYFAIRYNLAPDLANLHPDQEMINFPARDDVSSCVMGEVYHSRSYLVLHLKLSS